MWDPLRAEKDLEVGQYYMKKGDVDAAIDRFQDAALAKPGYAIPFRFLGEAAALRILQLFEIAQVGIGLHLGERLAVRLDGVAIIASPGDHQPFASQDGIDLTKP